MKRIVIYMFAAAAALSLASCKDFLEKADPLSQSTELTLSDYTGLDKATLGAYSYLAGSGWYGGVRVLTSEMRSGNGFKHKDHSSNRYVVEMNWNFTADMPGDIGNIWGYGYFTIARANNVINNLEGKETADVTTQDLNNLKAECLFLRALSHFEIVTLFGQPYTYKPDSPGCPIVLVTDESAKPARATVKEVYNQIVADLREAENIIDPDYTRSSVADRKAVVSIGAIRALLSRVYLYMGEWQKCADYATKVIEDDSYAMWDAEEYAGAWANNTGGSEVIFEIYKDLNNLSNLDCSYMTCPSGAYGDCLCSPELYGLYQDGDVRKDLYVQDSEETGLFWTGKYTGKGLYSPDANNVVVLRLSEMYLNRAEAILNGATSESTALEDLNVIAVNRGLDPYTTYGQQEIRTERRLELAWEGHYFYDLARWGVGVTRTPDAFLSATNANIEFPSHRWVLPIPKRELEVNENLVQNEKF